MSGYGRRYEDNPGMEMLQGVRMFGDAMQRGQQIEQGRMALEDEKGINAAYEHIANRVGQTGDISALDGDPIMNTRYGTMAAGKFLGQRAQNETSRLQMLKAMSAADDKFYQDTFRPLAFAAQDAFKSGDMRRFGGIVNELAAKSPMPYQVEAAGDGNFKVRFRSSADGGWVDTGQTMSPQQVMEQLGGIIGGEQKILRGATMETQIVNPRYLAAAARYRMGTIMGNAQALADPKQWIPMQKGGHIAYVIPQNRHDDYSASPSYRVLDERGGRSYMVGSMQELLDMGFVHADVKAKTDNVMGRRTGKAGPGGGNAHIVMLNAGYVWDKNQKWYFKAGADADGKPQADYSQPAPAEAYNEAMRIAGGFAQGIGGIGVTAGARGNDPAGILGQGRQAAAQRAQRPAPPNIPQAASGLNAGMPQDVQIRPPASVRLKKWQNANQ